jgi:putative endonuclease
MYTVYALCSMKDRSLYIGLTNNLNRRIEQHNNGKESTTKHKRPYHLFHAEELPDRIAARKREKFLKSGCGREFLKNKLCEDGGIGRRARLRA